MRAEGVGEFVRISLGLSLRNDGIIGSCRYIGMMALPARQLLAPIRPPLDQIVGHTLARAVD